MLRPSIRLSVLCPIQPPHATAAGLLCGPGDQERSIDLLHGQRAGGQQQPRRSTGSGTEHRLVL